MELLISLIVMCFSIGISQSERLPIDEIKCKLEDSTCLRDSMQKAIPYFMSGIPEDGIDVLDVMTFRTIVFNLSGLKFTLDNGTLKGMKNAVVDEVKWDQNSKKIEISLHLNSLLTGHYTASGNVLILPITGDGELRLKFKNIAFKLTLDYIMKEIDGKQYVVPTKYDFEFDVIGNAHYHLTNLFNGNKQLDEAMHRLLNENWRIISLEFGKPITKAITDKLYKNVKKFFSKYPISDLTLP